LATTYTYDGANRLIGRTDPGALSIAYRWNPNGTVFVLTNPDRERITYAYDRQTQRIAAADASGNITSIGYDALGRESTVLDSSGMRMTTTYDADSQITAMLTAFGANVVARLTYAYDPVGNRTTLTDLNGSQSIYAHDAKKRLIQDNTTGTNAHDYTYSHNSNDNCLTESETGVIQFWTYDAANRIVTGVASGLTTTYACSNERTLQKVTEPTVTYTYGQDVEYRLAWQSVNPGGIRTWI
jgi:YD repeat-containing protein